MTKTAKNKIARSEYKYALIFISPWIIGFLLFKAYPIFGSLFYSFTQYNIVEAPKWLGLGNIIKIFQDKYFYRCVGNNLFYALIGVPAYNGVALFLAYLLSKGLSGKGFFRMAYFLPVMMPPVASAILWQFMYNPDFGLFNTLLSFIGIKGPIWLADENLVKPALIFMSTWYMGRHMIIFLAAIHEVPQSLYEAARIDGAKEGTLFFRVTLPIITPVIFFNLVVGLIGSFQYFTEPFIMTEGGPNGASMTLAIYIYRNGLELLKMGYASGLSWMLFIIILTGTILLFRSQKLWVNY